VWWLPLLACNPTVPADLGLDVAVEDPGAGMCVSVQLDRWDADHREAQALTLAQLGVRVIRQDLRWDYVQPARDVWDWTTEDAVQEAADLHGLGVIAMLGYGAPWATFVEGADSFFPPDDPADFAAFAGAAAARYPDVRRFEIWNEPNAGYRFWKRDPMQLSGDPVAYADLFVAAADAIHAVDPDAEVIFGSVFFHEQGIVGGVEFLEAAIAARPEILEKAGAVSFHPYPLYPPRSPPEADSDGEIPLQQMISDVRAVTGDLPVVITEIGWPVWGAVTEEDQAAWLTRSYSLAHANGVRDVCWYTLEDRTSEPESPEDTFGLFRRGLQERRPAGDAFLTLYTATTDAVALVEATDTLGLPDPARGVRYVGEDRLMNVLWTTEGTVGAELEPSHRGRCAMWRDDEGVEDWTGPWRGTIGTTPSVVMERWTGPHARCDGNL
jgi:hypothetical protein